MVAKKHYISAEKKAELEEELQIMKTKKRKEIADALEYARGLGDLSENAEYHEAREAQATLEERIATVKELLKNASIIKGHKSDVAEIGTTVVVQKDGDKEKLQFNIVGSTEADFKNNKISNESPLGKAMLGKAKGEHFDCSTPKGNIGYTVVDIK